MSDLRFKPSTLSDVRELHAWLNSDAELFLWAGNRFTPPLDDAQLQWHFGQASPTLRMYSVFDDSELVGHAELAEIDGQQRTALLRRVIIAPERRRQGNGLSLVRAVLAVAFDELDLHRVELRVIVGNAAALAMYDRLGFTVEGRLRGRRRSNNGAYGADVLSIRAPEWRALSPSVK